MKAMTLLALLTSALLGCSAGSPGTASYFEVDGSQYRFRGLDVYAIDHGVYFEVGADGCGDDGHEFVIMIEQRLDNGRIKVRPFDSLIDEPVLVRIRVTGQTTRHVSRRNRLACNELPPFKGLAHRIRFVRTNRQAKLHLFYDENMNLLLKILGAWSADSQLLPFAPQQSEN